MQSTSLEPSYDLTPVRLVASTSEADAPTAAAAQRRTLFWNARQDSMPAATGGTDVEQTLPDDPAFEDPFPPIEVGPAPEAGPAPADSITFPEEGDIVMIPNSTARWVVYKVGAHALWLVDTNLVEPMEAQYPNRIEELSEGFDNGVYPAVSDYFGAPDLGNIARVVVTISGENAGASVSGSSVRQWHAIRVGLLHGLDLVAHEFIHVVQQTGAWGGPNPRDLHPAWFLEAQAQLGTEQYAWVQTNRTAGQNYGHSVAFDYVSPPSTSWRANLVGMRYFFGGAHPERPQECGWLLNDAAPCPAANLFYIVGWSLLRWLTDQYGRMYPGGEANLQRELIHGPDGPIETIEKQMGGPMETLLARWAAALYVDGRSGNLCCPPGRRAVRALRHADVRGCAALRPVHGVRGPAPAEEERRQPHPLRRAARSLDLHALRPPAVVRGLPVRTLRKTRPRALRARARPAGVSAELHHRGPRDGTGPRHLGPLGGCAAGALLRAAVP